ncbi:RES family NAD+ phosphorylase [Flavobacterium caeni]|uniref:RES domain-containing protein n=1 Tax=Flavobacterium caeni TaxID=490189 RepID=A0A1G5K4W3_9FLAO|nr:RES family NAD+ phosphorylase [Flavobacterium caeni]SCY95693.1 RES domain-containing protein [Flavobacterium caeni]
MIVFRLSKSAHAKDLSGKGAEKFGGRWNSKGVAMVYTSDSRALCTAEIAVHTPLGNLPTDYEIALIEIPENTIVPELETAELPKDWQSVPHAHSTQIIGDKFVSDDQFLVLKVPSAVVQGEFNYLINPAHDDFKSIKIVRTEPFSFDKRLFIR